MKINLLLLLSTTKTKFVFAFLLFALLFLSIGSNSAQAQAFRTTWITTDEQIIIPTTGTGYNYNITWTNLTNTGVGNGSATAVTTNNFTITGLQNNSTYEIAITGAFPRFFMNNNATEKTKLRTIEEWGNIAWISMAFAFDGCSNLTYGTSVDNPNLSGVNSLRLMFARCTNFNGNIGGWNTSTITDMQQMFFQASSFNQNIGSWNTGAVTNMYFMFGSAASFNQNIGNWNTGAVTNMSSMLSGASSFNQNIGNWNISSIVQQSFSDGMAFMLSATGLSTTNYDATLTGWAAQNVGTGIDLGAGQQRYCNAVAARNTLTSAPRNWIISGDTPFCGAEINLQGNGNNIPNATTTTSTVRDTDFGNVLTCRSITKTFTIQNKGATALTITGITITGTNATDFSLGTIPTTVGINGIATFTVTFNPSVIGNRVATINIANNDSDENPYTFAINGNGTTGTSSEIFVRQTGGNDANAGTSFATAFATLQKALENACVGAKIYVAKGTYKPSQQYNFSTGNPSTGDVRAASFKISDGVEVYGGFAGTETGAITQAVLDARDFSSNTTILSGDLLGNDVVTGTFPTLSYTNYADNVYHVVFTKNVSTATKVNGVTIKSGNASGTFPNFHGAGWYNDGQGGVSNPTLTNCSFSQNNATSGGGGMFNLGSFGSSNPILTNCFFYQNNSQEGGGIHNSGFVGISSPILTNCSFSQNNAVSDGGAMYNNGFTGSSNPIITNCSFSQNNATNGGGMSSYGNPIIRNSIFWGNTGNGKSWNNVDGTVNIAYSLVEETQATITSGVYAPTTIGDGMVYTQNPLFVNAATGDLSLQAGSPAIDAGNDADISSGVTTDLAGNTRIQGTRVDMGAYERLVLAPEINVVGNSISILDGDTTPNTTDNTDFGNVATNRTFTYTIQNTGTAVLNITSIVSSGTHATDFVVNNAPTTVAAGSSATFDVVFMPSASGIRNATITINNNDVDEAAYDFAVQGTGVVVGSPLTFSANVTSTNCVGEIDLTVSGGSGVYTYLWSNGATTQDISSLQIGQYTVTITDNGTNYTATYLVSNTITWENQTNISITGNVVSKTGTQGWTSGANSTQQLSPTVDGWVNNTVTSTSTSYMFGLARPNTDVSFSSITYAWYVVRGGHAYPSYNYQVGTSVAYQVGDQFQVKREGNQMKFYKNNVVVYQYTVNSNERLVADVAIHTINGTAGIIQNSFCGTSGGEAYSAIVTDIACPTGLGSIDVTDIGGFTYAWSNGATTQDISNLTAGVYTLTLTKNGVSYTTSYLVGAALSWTGLADFTQVGENLQKTSSTNSWSSSANSTTSFSNNGGFIFMAQQNASYMVGLSSREGGVGFTSIGYAIYLASTSTIQIYENGVYKGNFGTYQVQDVFKIERIGTSIRYSKNGIPFYTSLTSSSTPLVADVSMFTGNGVLPKVLFIDCTSPALRVANKVKPQTILSEENGFQIYPNPSTGRFNIRFAITLTADTQVFVFDGIGRRVTTTTFEKGKQEFTVNLQNQPKGMYLIHFNQNGSTYSKSVIIE